MKSSHERERLMFSITPPRRSTSPDDTRRIAKVTIERLRPLDLDALVIYDIDDESDRNPEERPFPYLPTQDPADFHARYLAEWDRPVVVYRCVGKYQPADLAGWLAAQDPEQVSTVFVGASSSSKQVLTSLPEAHALWRATRPGLPMGGVAIPERHSSTGLEHERMLRKQRDGASFFVSQVVYDADAAKSMVSDYHYACRDLGQDPAPLIFTLSVCGSMRTLAFLEWLGVDVPRWMRNDLERSDDPLSASFDHCLATARELATFCRRIGAPYGFNVESVSISRTEIDASVRLAEHLRS
jgi:hypothetical protein